MKHRLLISAALLSLFAGSTCANVIDAARVTGGDRWFEVEMIIFERQSDGQSIESFQQDAQLAEPARYFDLLQALYQTDITPLLRQLELCPAEQHQPTHDQASQTSAEQDINLSDYLDLFRPGHLGAICIFEPQPALWQQPLFASLQWIADTPLPERLLQQPVRSGGHQTKPYLLSREGLQLNAVAQRLQQQAGIDVLLHSGFRQAPVTNRLSIPSRWYAGSNLQRLRHQHDNKPLIATTGSISLRGDPLLQRIEQRYQQLNTSEPLRLYRLSPAGTYPADAVTDDQQQEPLWQLDGFVRIHLDHYLFMNSDFIVRHVDEEGAILQQRIQFSRRVISGEIHYIDHPRLGMVLQIRRYEPPAAETERSNSDQ